MNEPVDLDELERIANSEPEDGMGGDFVLPIDQARGMFAELRDSRRSYRELASEVWCLPPEEAADAEIDHADTLAEAKRMNRRIMELEREKKGEPCP